MEGKGWKRKSKNKKKKCSPSAGREAHCGSFVYTVYTEAYIANQVVIKTIRTVRRVDDTSDDAPLLFVGVLVGIEPVPVGVPLPLTLAGAESVGYVVPPPPPPMAVVISAGTTIVAPLAVDAPRPASSIPGLAAKTSREYMIFMTNSSRADKGTLAISMFPPQWYADVPMVALFVYASIAAREVL